mmetsp:Transcript_3596/g.7498  ORF Transcript_3596/g.7498 Transcript_3596/m.7498 type:complete len:280 (+) Transcript_3596:193-1032(+)
MREATSERQANDRPRRRASDNRLVFETLEALYVAHAACLVLELEDLFASMHVDHVLESELPAGDRLGVGRARVEVDEARVVEDEAALFARVVAAPEAIHVDAHVDAGLCLVVEQSLVDLGEDQAGGGSDADDSDSALPHRVHVHDAVEERRVEVGDLLGGAASGAQLDEADARRAAHAHPFVEVRLHLDQLRPAGRNRRRKAAGRGIEVHRISPRTAECERAVATVVSGILHHAEEGVAQRLSNDRQLLLHREQRGQRKPQAAGYHLRLSDRKMKLLAA